MRQTACWDDPNRGQFAGWQAWELRTATGEIVSRWSHQCLTASDARGALVFERPCNGSIAQRWFI